MIDFRCECGKPLRAHDEDAGQLGNCPACNRQQTIPAGADVLPPVVRPAPPREGPRPRRRFAEEDDRLRSENGAGRATSGNAVAAFVLGLISIVVPIFASLAAIILSLLGLGDVSRGRGRVGGKGLAVTGLVLGVFTLLAGIALVGVGISWGLRGVREATARVQTQNNLKIISLDLINYADVRGGQLPPPVVHDAAGRPLYSWRVLLLQNSDPQLFQQFHLDEAWDSAHNRQFLRRMPKHYAHPLDPEALAEGLTHYQLIVGTDVGPGLRPIFIENPKDLQPCRHLQGAGLFETSSAALRYPHGITDGVALTILVAEAADPVPWTKPADLPYSRSGPLPRLGGHFRDGYFVATADGLTHRIQADHVREESLRAAITANGTDTPGPELFGR
jgi:hypothetical protein